MCCVGPRTYGRLFREFVAGRWVAPESRRARERAPPMRWYWAGRRGAASGCGSQAGLGNCSGTGDDPKVGVGQVQTLEQRGQLAGCLVGRLPAGCATGMGQSPGDACGSARDGVCTGTAGRPGEIRPSRAKRGNLCSSKGFRSRASCGLRRYAAPSATECVAGKAEDSLTKLTTGEATQHGSVTRGKR